MSTSLSNKMTSEMVIDDGGEVEDIEVFCGVGKGRRKQNRRTSEDEVGSDGKLVGSVVTLKKADIARISVDRERLALDREHVEREIEDKAEEREFWHGVGATRDKLELEILNWRWILLVLLENKSAFQYCTAEKNEQKTFRFVFSEIAAGSVALHQ